MVFTEELVFCGACGREFCVKRVSLFDKFVGPPLKFCVFCAADLAPLKAADLSPLKKVR